MFTLLLFLVLHDASGIFGRSVSIFFSNQEKFHVREIRSPGYITLSDNLEKELFSENTNATSPKVSIDNPEDPWTGALQNSPYFYTEETTALEHDSDVLEPDDVLEELIDLKRFLHPDDSHDDDNDCDNEDTELVRSSREKRTTLEQWKQGNYVGNEVEQSNDTTQTVWEDVTDEDYGRIQREQYLQILKYVGITIGSVAGFSFLAYCFIRDPMAFIFSFGSCCPCCILCCPCIKTFVDKYMNPDKIVRDCMNKYMPGIIVRDDGTIDTYPITDEETKCLHAVIEEITDSF
ncbi:hypothetical protein ACJMK2_025158 [Sinanodonta woodiana]|uniref:Uncharacterized protein n=1 Tax=Sinanodonta woodiana TaxID=1069815 RepID=A0ABD3XH64_SINWO